MSGITLAEEISQKHNSESVSEKQKHETMQ